MKFKYKSQDASGRIYKGTIKAENKESLSKQLRIKNETLIFAREIKKYRKFNLDSVNNFFARVKLSEKIIFGKNLSTMIKAGLSLDRSLGVLERQSKNPKFKSAINKISQDINRGISFHEALAGFPKIFSSLFVSMVYAGEESGKLAESLNVVTKQLDKSYNLKRKIRGAMIYPAIIMIAMVIISILMLIYVVPVLASTFDELGVELPATTQAVISISNFLTEHTLSFFVLIIAFFTSLSLAMKSKRGKKYFNFILLHLPVISTIVKQANTARTARTLSSLLSSGVDISDSLSITKNVLQNSYYKEVLDSARENIQKGRKISEAFSNNPNLYPVLATEMIEVGEETGSLPKMLLEVAEFYESEVETATKDISTIVEPVLMIVIGAAVGFFAISMIEPMYSLSSSI